jgi:hypothetical protein
MPRQAPRSPRSRWLLGLALPALAVLGGCDTDSGKADKAVSDDLAQAASSNTNTADGQKKAHAALDSAVKVQGASLTLQLQTKAELADAELRLAQDGAVSVARNTSQIDRLVDEIGQLNDAVAADNRLATALGQYEPTKILDRLKAQSTALAGSDEKPDWMTTDAGTLPSQAAADKAAAALQQQIDQLNQQIKTDTDQRTDLITKADQFNRQSEQAQGKASVDLFVQGADARQQAADLGAKLEGEQSQLARAQADLAVQQGEQASVKAAAAAVDERTAATNQTWTATQEQARLVKAHAASLLGDESAVPVTAGKPGPATIAAKSAELARLLKENRALRSEVESHYNNAVGFYKDAYDLATKLMAQLSDPAHTERPERTDKAAWDVERAATDPSKFRYLQATVQLDRAEFYARAAAEAKGVADVIGAVRPVLEAASLTVPPGLDDSHGDAPVAVTNARKVAMDGFKEVVDNLTNVTNGAAPAEVKQGADVLTMFAQYGWSVLLASAGDANEAAGHLQAAQTARENAANLPGTMPPLPAALMPPATSGGPAAAEPAATPAAPTAPAAPAGRPGPTPRP